MNYAVTPKPYLTSAARAKRYDLKEDPAYVFYCLRKLTGANRTAIALFKALELTNVAALQALAEDSDNEKLRRFQKTVAKRVRKAMRDRSLTLTKGTYSLQDPRVTTILDYGARRFYLGIKDTEGEMWQQATELSHKMLCTLGFEIRLSLCILYMDMDNLGYPYPPGILHRAQSLASITT